MTKHVGIAASLQQSLLTKLQPLHLDIVNESNNHSVPANSETHFRVVIVSEAFTNKSRVQSHQIVYATVRHLMQNPIHALALHTYTASQWQTANPAPSPQCHPKEPLIKSMMGETEKKR